jgi:hypothetical protein
MQWCQNAAPEWTMTSASSEKFNVP